MECGLSFGLGYRFFASVISRDSSKAARNTKRNMQRPKWDYQKRGKIKKVKKISHRTNTCTAQYRSYCVIFIVEKIRVLVLRYFGSQTLCQIERTHKKERKSKAMKYLVNYSKFVSSDSSKNNFRNQFYKRQKKNP